MRPRTSRGLAAARGGKSKVTLKRCRGIVLSGMDSVFTTQDLALTINGSIHVRDTFMTSSALSTNNRPRQVGPPGLAKLGASTSTQASTSFCLAVNNIAELKELASMFAATGMFNRSGSQSETLAKCCVQLMAGMEAGFSPFASITGIYVVNGRPGFSAQLLAQAIKRHPNYDYQVTEKTSEICRITFFNGRGQEIGKEQFTIEMARRAGLVGSKGPWQQYPEAMLFARCLTAGMRTHCPDALGGHAAYTPEEIGGTQYGQIDEYGMVVVDDVTEPTPAPVQAPPAQPAAKPAAAKRKPAQRRNLSQPAPKPAPDVPVSEEPVEVEVQPEQPAATAEPAPATQPERPKEQQQQIGIERYEELVGMGVSVVGIAAILEHLEIAMKGIESLGQIADKKYEELLGYLQAETPENAVPRTDLINSGQVGNKRYDVSSDQIDEYLDALGLLFNE